MQNDPQSLLVQPQFQNIERPLAAELPSLVHEAIAASYPAMTENRLLSFTEK